ncbi:aminotransferase class IV [Luteolibacter yonseiensis]|uniref:branched-chain-amino-acid transaminase n=1 Tax=Luteolibacter yonseiensis TaxID=1144680 RepID=A0A934R4C0_9BACT|nr:aminotransferase class IV [Luteolibacter yonseiensis]MBK1818163.1 aminotransferase class IV [Luteolibacter yonseiensis]
MSEIWCNGGWLPAAGYPGSAQDRGAFLGLGLFETMLGLDGSLVFADRHVSRLRKSGERFGWLLDLPDLREIASELLLRNRLIEGKARLRLIVTAGSGLHNDLTPGADRLIWLSAFPGGEVPESIRLCLSPWPRNERSPLAGLKTACYAENMVALNHARQLGFEETVFLNTAGNLCETATANLFLVKDGALLTPSSDSGCLPGIGREVLLEIAGSHGIATDERTLGPEDLYEADEIFISSSTRGPVAVSRFEDRDLVAGPVTRALGIAYAEAVALDVRR